MLQLQKLAAFVVRCGICKQQDESACVMLSSKERQCTRDCTLCRGSGGEGRALTSITVTILAGAHVGMHAYAQHMLQCSIQLYGGAVQLHRVMPGAASKLLRQLASIITGSRNPTEAPASSVGF